VLLISDLVLESLEAHLAAHAPERGGGLIGPRALRAVSEYLPDRDARTSAVSFQPSERLALEVQDRERVTQVSFRGLCHSHPAQLDRPSGPDRHEAGVGLGLNPHMSAYLIPIVTAGGGSALGDHESALPSGKVSWFEARRTRDGFEVAAVPVHIARVGASLRRAVEVLGLEEVPAVRDVEVDGVPLLGAAVGRWSFLLPWSMATAPTVLEDGEPLHLPWDLRRPAEDRLAAALVTYREGQRGAVLGSLVPGGVTRALRRAVRTVARRRTPDLKECLARTAPIFSAERAASRHVVVVGAGSVGSTMADALARTGIGRFTVLDPDTVEEANLSRTIYIANDVGYPKVDALAARLRAAQPGLRVRGHAVAADATSELLLTNAITTADLVVAATDDPAAQLLLNRLAADAGVPSLFVGLTAGALGGEVLVVVPKRTPCYACALAIRHHQPSRLQREVDYGTGRLHGEPALGCDIAHVTTAATRLALSLLAAPETELAGFAGEAVRTGQTYLTLSTTPNYWCFPAVFGDVPGQYAFQSVWMTPERRPYCAVCGDALAVPRASPDPDVSHLRAIAHDFMTPTKEYLR